MLKKQAQKQKPEQSTKKQSQRQRQRKPEPVKKKKEKEITNYVQDLIPIKDIRNGLIETTDNRYIKIIEIEPINFMLRSEEEKNNIIYSFASWLKISNIKLQFKSITKRADAERHIELLKKDMAGGKKPLN